MSKFVPYIGYVRDSISCFISDRGGQVADRFPGKVDQRSDVWITRRFLLEEIHRGFDDLKTEWLGRFGLPERDGNRGNQPAGYGEQKQAQQPRVGNRRHPER